MPMKTTLQEPVEPVEKLKSELADVCARLERRIESLEARLAELPAPVRAHVAVAKIREDITPETVAIIAAAVTAFLGKKVKIRRAVLIESGTSPWAQQGRAIIQASHNLAR